MDLLLTELLTFKNSNNFKIAQTLLCQSGSCKRQQAKNNRMLLCITVLVDFICIATSSLINHVPHNFFQDFAKKL